MSNNKFPNGFTSWYETFFLVAEVINNSSLNYDVNNPEYYNDFDHLVEHHNNMGGTMSKIQLCKEITDAFEKENKNKLWDGEWYEEVEKFCKKYTKGKL